jgi:hypothetical protein
MTQYQYKLGTAYGNMVNLESMSPPVPAPKHSLIIYSKPTNLGDATVKGLGWRTTTWHWDFLTQAQYTQLRTYCSGLSANVYVNTKVNAGTYQTYTAVMVWPATEPEYNATRLLDITVEFRALAEASS